MANISGRRFASFRIPERWGEQERSLVRQIQDLFDRVFNLIKNPPISKAEMAARSGTGGNVLINSVQKVGNLVSFGGRIHGMTTNNTAAGTVFTLPAGYRPAEKVYTTGNIILNNAYLTAMFEINMDGTVVLNYSSSATITGVYVSGTFAAKGN